MQLQYILGDLMTEVKIIYCSPSGFATQAKELQNLITDEFKNVKVKLEKGDKGIFDVYLEEKKIFSRFKEKGFPDFDKMKEKILDATEEM